MMKIEINEEFENLEHIAATLDYIKQLLQAGNTSGYYPTWEVTGEEEEDSDDCE